MSPLNISQNITVTKYQYVDILNRIHFNLDYDNNDLINDWFQYLLFRYQDQIYYQQSRIGKIDKKLEEFLKSSSPNSKTAEQMMVKKLFS